MIKIAFSEEISKGINETRHSMSLSPKLTSRENKNQNNDQKVLNEETYLRSSAFTNCDYPILIRMKAHPNLAHRLGVGNRGWEVSFPIQPSKQTLPLVVPFCSVWQAPRNQIHQLSSRQLNLQKPSKTKTI